MKIRSFTYSPEAGLRLASINGTREELATLRDTIYKLLKTSEGDTRRHTQAVQFSGTEGLMISKDAES